MQSNVEYYRLYTLVDITQTNVTRGPDTVEREQQRNFDTVLQAIGLITQPQQWLEFGEYFQGEQRVWVWQFATEHSDIFTIGTNSVGRLANAFDQVPIICGLDETARFMLPIFYPYGAIKNIYFKKGYWDINNV